MREIVRPRVEQYHRKRPTTELLHKTFATTSSNLNLPPDLAGIARANLVLIQIPSNPHPPTLLRTLSPPPDDLIENPVDGTADLVDEANEAAITYNDKVARLRALHAR